MQLVSRMTMVGSPQDKAYDESRPNWLLRGLLLVSLVIHLVMLAYFADIYTARQLSFIELSLRNISKPFLRDIPRPRFRPKERLRPHAVQNHHITKPLPQFEPLKIDSFNSSLPDSIVETLGVPKIPGIPQEYGTSLNADDIIYTSPKDYLETIRNTILRYKQYPPLARSRQLEGRVTMQFVIKLDGTLKDIKVISPSHHEILDAAALQALQNAAPFSPPPQRFFKSGVPVQITIVFELTAT